jgi:hypothetical protein
MKQVKIAHTTLQIMHPTRSYDNSRQWRHYLIQHLLINHLNKLYFIEKAMNCSSGESDIKNYQSV